MLEAEKVREDYALKLDIIADAIRQKIKDFRDVAHKAGVGKPMVEYLDVLSGQVTSTCNLCRMELEDEQADCDPMDRCPEGVQEG